jgi:hypothetical protein
MMHFARVEYKRMRGAQMKYLDLTFSTPHKNLACDEALLDRCEERALWFADGQPVPMTTTSRLVSPLTSVTTKDPGNGNCPPVGKVRVAANSGLRQLSARRAVLARIVVAKTARNKTVFLIVMSFSWADRRCNAKKM